MNATAGLGNPAAVPDGQKNAFLVQAILESEEKETFETTLRRVLREELQSAPCQPVTA